MHAITVPLQSLHRQRNSSNHNHSASEMPCDPRNDPPLSLYITQLWTTVGNCAPSLSSPRCQTNLHTRRRVSNHTHDAISPICGSTTFHLPHLPPSSPSHRYPHTKHMCTQPHSPVLLGRDAPNTHPESTTSDRVKTTSAARANCFVRPCFL
jgi:hypothetical protein